MGDPDWAGAISGPADGEFPDAWYELATAEHFWMRWRLSVCRRLLSDHEVRTKAELKVLEVGCAHGALQNQLESCTAWVVDGCDLNRSAVAQNPGGRGRSMLYDVHDRRAELAGAYDALVLFDVIEHIAETTAFLQSCSFHLRPGGMVLINVPALMGLYSRYDVVAGHYRRYSRSSLAAALGAAGLELVASRYWGLSLVPLLALRKLVVSTLTSPQAVLDRGFRPPGRIFSALMGGLMRVETGLLHRPPLGTSLMALARRPAT